MFRGLFFEKASFEKLSEKALFETEPYFCRAQRIF